MAPPPIPPAGSLRLRVLNLFTRVNVIAYRASRGRLGGRMHKVPVCILHTVGRKSGKRRETPLLDPTDGDKVVLVASAGGRWTSPAWYHNLRAMDAAEVEILGRRTKMTPRLASAEERADYWPKVNEIIRLRRLPGAHQAGDPGRRHVAGLSGQSQARRWARWTSICSSTDRGSPGCRNARNAEATVAMRETPARRPRRKRR